MNLINKYKIRKKTELIFEKEILQSIHNIELPVDKLIQNGLLKKAKLKDFKNFKQFRNYFVNQNKFNNHSDTNNKQNQNFTYLKTLKIGKLTLY